MFYVRSFVFVVLAQFFFLGSSFAQTHGTAAEAKALAEKAVAHVKAVGPEKAFEEFSAKDGKWQDRDLYVFANKYDGTTAAHGANKTLVGKNLLDMKDANGKQFLKEMTDLAKAKGSGWVDYLWTSPQTKKTEPKSTYVLSIPGYEGFVGVGIYK